MTFKFTKFIVLVCSVFVVVSCGPKKAEETTVPDHKQETPMMELKKPEAPASQLEQDKKKDETLTPEQKEELEIDEDNVINPFPG